MSDTHKCPAPGCYVLVTSNRFACREHWRVLPAGYRDEITRAWRSGLMEEHSAAMDDADQWYRDNLTKAR